MTLIRSRKFTIPFLLAMLWILSSTHGQEGDYFLTHHTPNTDRFDNVNFSIIQDHNSLMWLANRKGIVQYDGTEWRLTPTPTAIFDLVVGDDNVLYAGGRNVIGRIQRNNNSEVIFQPILHSDEVDDVLSILSKGQSRYFINSSSVFEFDVEQDTLRKYDFNPESAFQELFLYDDRILVSTQTGQLHTFDQGAFSELDLFSEIEDGVYWLTQHPEGKTAILSTGSRLWLDDGQLGELDLEDDGYLEESVPIRMEWVDDDLVSISTLSGGVVFVSTQKKEIVEIINYHTGLPENQVYGLTVDRNLGVWATHDYGISRIAPLAPIRSFRNLPGLEGNIQSIINYQGEIYVGTSLGVYYLDKVQDYNEIVYFVKADPQPEESRPQSRRRETPPPPAPTPKKEETPQDDVADEEDSKKKKRGLFRFLKKEKEDQKKSDESAKEADPEIADAEQASPSEPEEKAKKSSNNILTKLFRGSRAEEASKEEWTRKVRRELLSVRYTFKKVDGIPAKTDQLVSTERGIVAGSLAGIYLIQGTESEQISDIPTRFIHYSPENNLLFGATFSNEVLTFESDGNGWTRNDLLEGLEDIVFQIAERQDEIWISSADSVYRLELDQGDLVDVDVIPIENPHFERTFVVEHGEEMIFVNSNSFYSYDPTAKQIKPSEALNDLYGVPERIFLTNDASLWTFNGTNWHIFDNEGKDEDLDFLNIFEDIRQLAYNAESDTYWVVTYDNEIFGIESPENSDLLAQNAVFLKEIRNKDDILLPTPRLKIDLENQALSFRFIQPDYTQMLDIEYRYRLIGLSDEWSSWGNSNNEFGFSYLPAKRYRLELETRDILGNTSSIEPIEFNVVPPYWRRSWFYAIEVVVFASLLILSIRLNRGNTRYRFVNRLLAFLTLILIVEFVQTIAQYNFRTESSPVFDFFIQVSVAVFILPLESLLRRAMFRTQAAEIADDIVKTAKKKRAGKKVAAKSA